MSERAEHAETTSDAGASAAPRVPGARAASETATLLCAVAIAVTLGVACGFWVNARLAASIEAAATSSASSSTTSSTITVAPARLLPDSTAAAEPRTDSESNADGDRNERRADAAAIAAADTRPIAREVSPTVKKDARGVEASEVEKGRPEAAKKAAGRGQGALAPCALYASASSLTIRGGGVAALILGGPGEAGRITVATPHWSDIAVFDEGRAAGDKGRVKYSVRSVSGRPGVYSVRFATPCGSKSITVTVTRP
jgi:hypothetical protein